MIRLDLPFKYLASGSRISKASSARTAVFLLNGMSFFIVTFRSVALKILFSNRDKGERERERERERKGG